MMLMILMQMQQVAEDGTWPFQLLQPRGCHFLSRSWRRGHVGIDLCTCQCSFLAESLDRSLKSVNLAQFGSLSLSSASRAVSCSVWYFVILPDVQSFGVKKLSIRVYYIYLSNLFIYYSFTYLFFSFLYLFIHIHSTLLLLYRYIH